MIKTYWFMVGILYGVYGGLVIFIDGLNSDTIIDSIGFYIISIAIFAICGIISITIYKLIKNRYNREFIIYKVRGRIISIIDPYGEENWEE